MAVGVIFMFFRSKKFMIPLIVVLALAAIFALSHLLFLRRDEAQIYGVSFSEEYAGYLELNPREVFRAILDDWGFRHLRLSAQWDAIEKQRGVYDFSSLDWQMDEAAKRGAKVILVVGQKIPRWPECHPPKWAAALSDEEYFSRLDDLAVAVVDRYKNHPALEMWQVENEPFLPFGVCRAQDSQRLAEEVSLVRRLDPTRKILVTDSGEMSTWQRTARVGDYFGTTLYRVVWSKTFGYFNYDWLPPAFYRLKLWLAGRDAKAAFVAELQAEPWVPNHDIKTLEISEQYKSMSPDRFNKNIDYSRRVGFPRAYLWGAEWWYWMEKKQGIADFANFAKSLKKE